MQKLMEYSMRSPRKWQWQYLPSIAMKFTGAVSGHRSQKKMIRWKLNGGDIKAVQGDSGHSQINMVTDVYSHIIDDDRRKNAELFEEAFYEKKDLDPSMHAHAAGKTIELPTDVDAELLAKVLSNPEMAALLSTLAKSLKKK